MRRAYPSPPLLPAPSAPLTLLICLAVPRLPVFWIPLSPLCDSINMKSRREVSMFSCLYNVPLLNSPLSHSILFWASLALSIYSSSSSAGDRMAAGYIQFLVSSLLHPVYPLKYNLSVSWQDEAPLLQQLHRAQLEYPLSCCPAWWLICSNYTLNQPVPLPYFATSPVIRLASICPPVATVQRCQRADMKQTISSYNRLEVS